MSIARRRLVLVVALGLAGCVSLPTGPSVMVLPGTGKSFDQFRMDDQMCRQYAFDQIGGQTAARAQESSAVTSAAVGAIVGALAGAAIGGDASAAAAGAGVGLVGGSLAGASAANVSAYDAQYRYDMAYQQCMYAKGHRVPVYGRYSPEQGPFYSSPPPPPPGSLPPPR
jgi:hypothetical protein